MQSLCDAEGHGDYAVLFMDMDRFKVVNDTIGHRIGDSLLIGVAKRLNSVVSDQEVVARLGGDEFAIIVPRMEGHAQVEELAKQIVEVVAEPFELDRHRIRTSVSIGIAIGPHDGNTADDLLVASDLALYAVKTGAVSYTHLTLPTKRIV